MRRPVDSLFGRLAVLFIGVLLISHVAWFALMRLEHNQMQTRYAVEEVVDQAIQLKVPAIWMQEEVIHEKAAQKARAAGIFVVMDRCILLEHRARFR